MAKHTAEFLACTLFRSSFLALPAEVFRKNVSHYTNTEMCALTEQVRSPSFPSFSLQFSFLALDAHGVSTQPLVPLLTSLLLAGTKVHGSSCRCAALGPAVRSPHPQVLSGNAAPPGDIHRASVRCCQQRLPQAADAGGSRGAVEGRPSQGRSRKAEGALPQLNGGTAARRCAHRKHNGGDTACMEQHPPETNTKDNGERGRLGGTESEGRGAEGCGVQTERQVLAWNGGG